MSEMTLRSNQMANMTETRRAPKTTSTLTTTMMTAPRSTPFVKSGSGIRPPSPGPTSTTGDGSVDEGGSTRLIDGGGVELKEGHAARDAGIGADGDAPARPGRPHPDLVTGLDTEPVQSRRGRDAAPGAGERRERCGRLDHRPVVVEPATHDETPGAAIAGGGGAESVQAPGRNGRAGRARRGRARCPALLVRSGRGLGASWRRGGAAPASSSSSPSSSARRPRRVSPGRRLAPARHQATWPLPRPRRALFGDRVDPGRRDRVKAKGAPRELHGCRPQRDDDTVRGRGSGQRSDRAPGMHRRNPLDLGPDPVQRLETEIGAQTVGELGCDHPVGPGHARAARPWRRAA